MTARAQPPAGRGRPEAYMQAPRPPGGPLIVNH